MPRNRNPVQCCVCMHETPSPARHVCTEAHGRVCRPCMRRWVKTMPTVRCPVCSEPWDMLRCVRALTTSTTLSLVQTSKTFRATVFGEAIKHHRATMASREVKERVKRIRELSAYEPFMPHHRAELDELLFQATRVDKPKTLCACPKTTCSGAVALASLQCMRCNIDVCEECLQKKDPHHVCSEQNVADVCAMWNNAKPCPSCHALVAKDDGCDDMFCLECRTFFDWETLEITRQNTNEYGIAVTSGWPIVWQSWGDRIHNVASRVDGYEFYSSLPDAVRHICMQGSWLTQWSRNPINIVNPNVMANHVYAFFDDNGDQDGDIELALLTLDVASNNKRIQWRAQLMNKFVTLLEPLRKDMVRGDVSDLDTWNRVWQDMRVAFAEWKHSADRAGFDPWTVVSTDHAASFGFQW
jgi:hypothetical protein